MGRLVASRWTGEKVEKDVVEGSAETHDNEKMPAAAHGEENDAYASEDEDEDDPDDGDGDDDDDDRKYEYDDLEDDMPQDVPEDHYGDSSSSDESKPNDDTDFSGEFLLHCC